MQSTDIAGLLHEVDGSCKDLRVKNQSQGRRPEDAETGVFGDPQNIYMYRAGAKDDNKKKGITFLSDVKRDERAKTTKETI